MENKHQKMNHDKHAGHRTEDFLKKFLICLILTIPVIIFPGIVAFFLGSVIFFYGGMVFIRGAVREIKARLLGMMVLISLAICTAYLYSVFAVFTSREPLFWELATLITIMLLGHWIEMRAVAGTRGALKELSKLLPDTAEVMKGGKSVNISINELKEGDIIIIKPGSRIPADGEVLEGISELNESMVTGESASVQKKKGSEVIAGTINGDGLLTVRVAKIGSNTFLAGVMRLVAEAEVSKSRLQLLADRAAYYLTIIAVISGVLTFTFWLVARAGLDFAIERLVAVLVIACPHALGLAIPLVASISTGLAAKSGFLIRKRLALESAREINVVVFDKTGTLTKGEFGVTDIWHIVAKNEKEVLIVAASIDAGSEHPISKAIVKKAREENLEFQPAQEIKRIPGRGVRGIMNGEEIFVGGQALVEEKKLDLQILPEIFKESKQGKTVIYVIRDKKIFGAIALADVIKEESKKAIEDLKRAGIEPIMITGDSEDVAMQVSRELGIEKYFARVLPGEKSTKIKFLQEKGNKVAMVGDGINDAPALAQADVGIAIGAGTNVAIESAGIILARNDPRDIPKIINLSRLTYRKMIQNLFWATGYNIVALPLAAGVLVSKGILLQPAISAVFMSLSTIIVAINATLLRRSKL